MLSYAPARWTRHINKVRHDEFYVEPYPAVTDKTRARLRKELAGGVSIASGRPDGHWRLNRGKHPVLPWLTSQDVAVMIDAGELVAATTWSYRWREA